jgi:hypothetical protein
MANQNDIQKTLIDELGLADLPQEKQEQLLIKMTEVVLKRIFVETMEKLTEQDQDAYSKLIEDSASPEEIEKFLTEKIAGYDEMVKKIVEEFKEEIKSQGV